MGRQGTGRSVTKYNEDGFRTAEFPKGEYEVLSGTADDLTAVLEIGVNGLKEASLRGGVPAAYEPTETGLQRFYDRTVEYFNYINRVNSDPEIEKKVIPDIESWCNYLGITRATLAKYRNNRGERWGHVIDYAKQVIVSGKKQLASTYRIPPMFAVFDLVNNTDTYRSTNEFHIVQDDSTATKERRRIEEEISDAGLMWDEETQRFIPKGD